MPCAWQRERHGKTIEKERRNSAPTVFLRSLLYKEGKIFLEDIRRTPVPVPEKRTPWEILKSYLNLYFVDAMSAMAQGLFASLLIGTIISTLGTQLDVPLLTEIGDFAKSMAGPAMAIAIGYALKAPASCTVLSGRGGKRFQRFRR